ncbi:hypothetical protein D9M68_971840 [compost metagenome]
MFLCNMLVALVLVPALACFLLQPEHFCKPETEQLAQPEAREQSSAACAGTGKQELHV